MSPGVVILFLILFTVFAYLEPLAGVVSILTLIVTSSAGIYDSGFPEIISLQASTILLWYSIVLYFFAVTD